MTPQLRSVTAAAIGALFIAPAGSVALAQTLEDVVISASRTEQRSFDAPGSVQSVGRDVIESAGPQINISEALGAVPGIHVANRNNFSQDLQISIRGFGSRAPFGVRGVRLIIDGIPQTLPDGQGQSSQFALTSADRIEVLKGPMAMLYGNAAGGVVQVLTRSPGDTPELSLAGYAGSYSLTRTSTQYSETRGHFGFVVDYATFRSDGFRDYSHASREQLNAKLEYRNETSKSTVVFNVLRNDTQEPGSLSLSQYNANRNQALTDNVSGRFGKEFTQGMLGLSGEHRLSADSSLSYRAYGGKRDLDNPLSNTSTGYSMIDRSFYGIGLASNTKSSIGDIPVMTTIGLDVDHVLDKRTARQNAQGVPTGPVTRDENNVAYNTDLFVQSQWFFSPEHTGLLGLRATRVTLKVEDHYVGDSLDGSGSRRYSGVSPVIGLTRHLTPELNVFAQYGRGFETPTLNEILYTPTANKLSSTNQFYGAIDPARSHQFELGAKWRPHPGAKLDAALFYAKTRNDIAPLNLNPSASTWQNVDTKRYGLEFAGLVLMPNNMAFRGAATWMQAEYAEGFSTVSGGSATAVTSGSTMPGVPQHRVVADLSWRSSGWLARPSGSFTEAGIEFHGIGRTFANSQNNEQVGSYELMHLRLTREYRDGPHRLTLLARIDNALDKRYVGSVVVDQSSRRYYEPGMPRNWLLGAKYTLNF